jgi:RimJ/RimL family protein N-acetyltransferase
VARLALERQVGARELLVTAGDFLLCREAEHNLILGICARLEADPAPYGHAAYLASVANAGGAVAVALRTPPYNVVLSEVGDLAAVALLVDDAARAFDSLPGVTGPPAAAGRFAELWAALCGVEARPGLRQRIFRAESAMPPAGVPGSMRRAGEEDAALLAEWSAAFTAEALPEAPPGDAAAMVRERLSGVAGAGFFLWEDEGRPVALAGCAGRTPNGIRIGPVYTPPDLRGRGYASALTAALTLALLAGGRRFCFLFTDLANPTSNRLYERLGYERVADVDEYRFT